MNQDQKRWGWNFPVGIDYQTGNIEMTDLKKDIRQSILILLSTNPGERLIHGNYGCNLSQFMFEPITYDLLRRIRWEVTTAINRWEKRISQLEIDILNDVAVDSRIVISIKYTIASLQDRDQLYYSYDLS